MTSVAQNIPEDILRQIFAHFSTHLIASYSKAFPWYLGHVCSKWRITFSSMPEFWGYIRVLAHRYITYDLELVERIANIVSFFLEHRPGDPFDLHYSCLSDSPGSINAVETKASHIFEKLVEESSRWRNVNLYLHRSEIPTLSRAKGRLQSLHSLSLDQLIGDSKHPSPPLSDIFVNAPSLTHLELSDPTRDWDFNWTQLTSLTLRDVTRDELAKILLRTPNVERLIIEAIVYETFQDRDDADMITLPRLKYLEAMEVYSWLGIIKAPTLQELQLVSIYDPVSEYGKRQPSPRIVSFLRKSDCELKHLTLFRYSEPIDLDLLQCVPELTHLTLLNCGVQEVQDSIAMLSKPMPMGSSHSAFPLPRLQVLRISYSTRPFNFPFIIGSLLNLMAKLKEYPPSERLRYLIVDRLTEACNSDEELELDELCGDLDIQLQFV